MRLASAALTVIGSAVLLSACNTTETLIPKVGIGETADIRSSPVTQNEVERMAGSPRRQQLAAPSQGGGYHPAYDQQAYEQRAYRPGPGAPPTTLQEQADALNHGNRAPSAAPVESAQLQPPASGEHTPSQQQAPEQTAAIAAPRNGNTIRFLPIIGAPVQVVTPLSRQLGADARAHGLTIKNSGDTSSDYILKGYLSAFTDNGSVTVVYVWDVLDNSGNRLHRIQGQESVPTAATDPWAGVPASVMQQIASKTIQEFTSWRRMHGG